MIPNKDRVPLGNGKSRMLRAPADTPETWADFRAKLLAGEAYVDLGRNNASTGPDAGIVQAGTALNKAKLDELLAASGTSAGTATALTLAQEGFTLTDGAVVRIKLHTDLQGGATLNVAGTGAKPIYTAKGKAVAGGYRAGSWLTLIYNGTNFILQGEGGGESRYGNGIGQISTYELMVIGNFSPFYGR